MLRAFRAFRALVAGLTVLQVLVVATDLGGLLHAPRVAADRSCCCGPHGVENGCTCTGPCCSHGPAREPGGGPALDDHCGARQPAPAGTTSLLPGTPVAVLLPRPPAHPSRPSAAADPEGAARERAPAEPPPRAADR